MSKIKLTLLGSVMAFGLAPQVVAQDATIVYADADTYEVVLDQPIAFELNEANFQSLRDLGVNLTPTAPEGSPAPAVPLLGTVPQSGQPITLANPSIGTQPPAAANMLDLPITSLPSIANLVDQVSPSVVNIIVRTDTGETTSEGQGSGFLISENLEVVTN